MNTGSSEIHRERQRAGQRERTGSGVLVLGASVLALAIFSGSALGAPGDSPGVPQAEPPSERPTVPASTTKKPAKPKKGRSDNGSGGVAPGAGKPDSSSPDRAPAFTEEEPSDSGGTSPDGAADSSGEDPLAVDPDSVPNFVIDEFEIPPFLLPIYQACGSEYGIPWQILAAINRIETAFGTNLSVSYAGAMGWMQFMPGTWEAYGVDANGDRKRDPYNPVDAICSAANYLEASGYAEDPRRAIFAYNRANWYVEDILQNARAYSEIPSELITALTGLTEGARFPVAGKATYEDQVSTESGTGQAGGLKSGGGRSSVEIRAAGGTPVIAVNDGVIKEINSASGSVTLEDAYGNRYTYSGLGSIARVHPVPRRSNPGAADTRLASSDGNGNGDATGPDAEMGAEKAGDRPVGAQEDEAPGRLKPARQEGDMEITEVQVDRDTPKRQGKPGNARPADGAESKAVAAATERRAAQEEVATPARSGEPGATDSQDMRGRVYAKPLRPSNQKRATVDGQSVKNGTPAAGYTGGVSGKPGDYVIYDGSKSGIYRFDEDEADLLPLKKGSRVIAGTILGRLAESANASIEFSIRPGGKGAVKIDPKPFLDGWRLLAETNIYSAKGRNRFAGRLGAGGVLLLSKSALQRRVLADPKISIHECGKTDIAVGAIDRRVLAVLAYLSAKGYSLMITSLYCGREASITTSGYVSNHSRGQAVDIAAINGEVITAGTQGPGSLTDRVSREVLALQGTMAPDEVITLMNYPQPAGFAMGDHDDHIHIGYSSTDESDFGGYVAANLGADQWRRLTRRLGQIRNPRVPDRTSPSALPAGGGGQGK